MESYFAQALTYTVAPVSGSTRVFLMARSPFFFMFLTVWGFVIWQGNEHAKRCYQTDMAVAVARVYRLCHCGTELVLLATALGVQPPLASRLTKQHTTTPHTTGLRVNILSPAAATL